MKTHTLLALHVRLPHSPCATQVQIVRAPYFLLPKRRTHYVRAPTLEHDTPTHKVLTTYVRCDLIFILRQRYALQELRGRTISKHARRVVNRP